MEGRVSMDGLKGVGGVAEERRTSAGVESKHAAATDGRRRAGSLYQSFHVYRRMRKPAGQLA